MTLVNRVRIFIRNGLLIVPGNTVVIGFSGGADSVVLAHIMVSLRHEFALRLHLAHYNHKLRKSAYEDERLVGSYAKAWNVPLTVQRRPGTVSRRRVPEEEARSWRYAFFRSVMGEQKANGLILAHTQNDVAETVLMRVIRGAGLNGLQAIRPVKMINGMRVVRPLLSTTRQDIEAYAKQFGLRYIIDATNLDKEYLRNKVRQELLPLLAGGYNSNICSVLAGLAQTAADDYEFLQEVLQQRIKENVVSLKGMVKIKRQFLLCQPVAMRRLLLRYAFEKINGNLIELALTHVAQAEEFIVAYKPGAVLHWPQNVKVNVTYHNVTIAYAP